MLVHKKSFDGHKNPPREGRPRWANHGDMYYDEVTETWHIYDASYGLGYWRWCFEDEYSKDNRSTRGNI